ncbi:transcriptional regulator [Prauserella marina]|nr:winged helix DNA-binding protein [Prauserella marina]ASR37713.1 transcriptional regulator [Prauserella marina]
MSGTVEDAMFADALVRLSQLVQNVFGEVARRHDLTPQQIRLLCVLSEGSEGMAALGRVLNLEKSSLSGFIDRVERRGLVERVRDSSDRRACQVALTERGSALATRTHSEVVAELGRRADLLGASERAVFAAAVDAMAGIPVS